jgi:hypothetical protein
MDAQAKVFLYYCPLFIEIAEGALDQRRAQEDALMRVNVFTETEP